jgi:hypothetical protein
MDIGFPFLSFRPQLWELADRFAFEINTEMADAESRSIDFLGPPRTRTCRVEHESQSKGRPPRPPLSMLAYKVVMIKSERSIAHSALLVLWHPWHGLLAYHPLYAVFCGAGSRHLSQGLWARKTPGTGIGWRTTCAHIYTCRLVLLVDGGFTFGMRGLAIASLVLVPVFIRHIDQELQKGRAINGWVAMETLAGLCSYLLLLQDVTHYFTLRQLVGSQWWELHDFPNLLILAVSIGVLGILWRAWRTCGMNELMLRGVAVLLACLAVRWVVLSND